jgi:sugar phosphate isomerase/epimerase
MRFGICADSSKASIVKKLGFDFIELGASELAPERSETDFAAVRERLQEAGLKSEAVGKLLPKDIRLVGPEPTTARAKAYLEVVLGRASELGCEVIVWGAAHARNVPDGFPKEAALEQFTDILRFAGGLAERYGLVIAVEPLRSSTTNTILTVQEAWDLAGRVGHSRVQVMADIYQMHENGEPLEAVAVAGGMLAHFHVSDPDRLPPGNPEHIGFHRRASRILQTMGYDGRVSIEARVTDFEVEASRALAVLRETFPNR